MNRRWTDDEDETLLELAAQGLRYADIAERLGRSRIAVQLRACQLGADNRRRPWRRVDDFVLRKAVEAGWSRDHVAHEMKRTPGAVQVRASRLGIRNPFPLSSFAGTEQETTA